MRKYTAKKRIGALCTAFLCAGALFAGTFTVPAPSKAETQTITCSIGYGVNILKDSFRPLDLAVLDKPVLDKKFMASEEMNLARNNEAKRQIGLGNSYRSYKDIADTTTLLRKNQANIFGEGYFFLKDVESSFGATLANGKFAAQYYYWDYNYSAQYSLTLEKVAYFSEVYADKLDEFFLRALEKLSVGEWTYSEFFDACGTHVVTGEDYGTRFDAYYGLFWKNPLSSEEYKEIEDYVGGAIGAVRAGESSLLKLPDSLRWKFGLPQEHCRIIRVKAKSDGGFDAIGYSGLKAFYDILPRQYADLAQPMKAAFKEYAEANTNLYEDSIPPAPPVDSSDSSHGDTPPPENDRGKTLKIVWIGVGGTVLIAGAVIIFCLCKKKKKK